MFKWNNMNGAASTDIVEEDYSIENNGHLVALAEAFDELAEINELTQTLDKPQTSTRDD